MEIRKTRQKKALIIEDNLMIQKIHSAFLTALNYQVVLTGSGEEAVSILKTPQEFDVVILDINLPKITGFEVCRIIREELKNKTIPIMGVTTITASEIKNKSILLGMNDIFTKPIDPNTLKIFLDTFVK